MAVVGVVQDQHPDRARLYAQWRQLEWPLYVDALNLLGHRVVPVIYGLDPDGTIRTRMRRPRELEGFLALEPASESPPADHRTAAPDPEAALRRAEEEGNPAAWTALGDAHFLTGSPAAAAEAYQRVTETAPRNATAHFRLGVALRRRSEIAAARPGDAQAAVAHWSRALQLRPGQYIWRRRLQQYGPRPAKPYNFYSWVEVARREIRARREEPVSLASEPVGSEIAPPAREGEAASPEGIPDPDPRGRIPDDEASLIRSSAFATPYPVRPGGHVRIRWTFRPDPERSPWWNNEGDPLTLHLELPEGWELVEGTFVHAGSKDPETREVRTLDCELVVPADASEGLVALRGYALYGVCEDAGGRCLQLRQDLEVLVKVDPEGLELR